MNESFVHGLTPEVFSIGPLTVRWYGLMYLLGFSISYLYLKKRHKVGLWALNPIQTQDLITYLLIGMLLGARMVYVLVYNPHMLEDSIWNLFAVWQGGLSYHGATIGFSAAMYLYSKRNGVGFMHLADNVCLCAGIGVFFGRIGNFINGELYGRITDVPWAVIFPLGGPQPRHPSQIYQGVCEGLLLFVILYFLEKSETRRGHFEALKKGKSKILRTGILASTYFALYGIARFGIEFFREPDPQLGYYFGWMTMGQILCSLMIVIGTYVLIRRIKKPIPAEIAVE